MSARHYLEAELYEELRARTDLFEFIEAAALDGIWYADLERPEHQWMSARFWHTVGHDPATKAHLASESLALVHPDDIGPAQENFRRHCADGRQPYDQVLRYRHKDGSTVWLRSRGIALRDASGKPVRFLGTHTDLTLQKLTEEALRQALEDSRRATRFLDAIVEHIPQMVFVKDAKELRFVRLNRAGEALLGVSRRELMGKNDFDFFPKAEAEFFQAKDRETLNGASLVSIPEEPIDTKSGRRWLHTQKVPLLGADGAPEYLLGISDDITERKQLTEVRHRLAAIVESSEDAVLSKTLEGTIVSWNRGAETLFGFTAEEMIGQPVERLLPEAARPLEAQGFERLRRGERVPAFETVRRRKDGTELEVSVTLSAIKDSQGAVTGVGAIVRDITERKTAERAVVRAKEAAEAANKELESFSYSVAHDLRAPLRSIDGFSQALVEDFGHVLGGEGLRYLGLVRSAAQRMAQLIDDLLTLSRVTRSTLVRGRFDISHVARSVHERLTRTAPRTGVEVVVEPGLVADGDARLVELLLDNLLANAWKFSSKREDARIEFGAQETEGGRAYFVRDNGAGFDMRYADKLFGVFQRLHGVSEFEGTGVGLATVLRIVQSHGGRVWGEGRVGEGATFYFTLGEGER